MTGLARMLPRLAPLAISQAPRLLNNRNQSNRFELGYLIFGVLIGVAICGTTVPQMGQPIARETSQRVRMGEAATGNETKPVGNEE